MALSCRAHLVTLLSHRHTTLKPTQQPIDAGGLEDVALDVYRAAPPPNLENLPCEDLSLVYKDGLDVAPSPNAAAS